ncbi:MAG: hypothetical protein JXA30_20505 [Deltaproteobacteria bacterium]|nr:hypothetical protein [Deltaproteobacteria bacterium]
MKNYLCLSVLVLGFFSANACSESNPGQGFAGEGVSSASGVESTGAGGSDGVAGSSISDNGQIPAKGSSGTRDAMPNTSGNGGTVIGGADDVSTGGGGGLETGGTDGPEIGGTGGLGGTGGVVGRIAPTVRNPKYSSMAPPLGEPLPDATPGQWTWIQIDGAISRDGSPAGFYYKFSATGDKNLMIYLVGGGACQDFFFCNNNPPNKDFSLTAESVLGGIAGLIGPDAEPQDPDFPRWQAGIFKNDPANPVKDWNMVFIPYVTGDVYAGNRPDAIVPGYPAAVAEVKMQFVGKPNMLKFLARIVPTFSDAPIVLLTGSSAGGLGALMNTNEVADSWIDQNKGAHIFVVDDAGPFFTDQYLEVCLQKRYRDYFNLNDTLPQDCTACFNADGGGITAGYLAYIIDKYPEGLLGGLIDSATDEIMELFFSDGLNNCDPNNYPVITYLMYPPGHYSAALEDLIQNHMQRMSSYVWPGTLHQNLFQTASGDRFYQTNGLNMTIAEWLRKLLDGEQVNIGLGGS